MSDGWANALPCPPLATPMIIEYFTSSTLVIVLLEYINMNIN